MAGAPYDASDALLTAEREQARSLCQQLSALPPSAPEERRLEVLQQLLGRPSDAYITPPFFCDYGYNLKFGSKVYFNFNCVVLDVAPVTIGDRTLFGPAVQIYTASHPMSAAERRQGIEFGKPVTIGDDVWVGGGSIICPGVNIGSRTVIGAGSVVTRDIPADVFAAGNPCRVIRQIDPED